MQDLTSTHFLWALTLGAVSTVSLPLGSLVGLNMRFNQRYIGKGTGDTALWLADSGVRLCLDLVGPGLFSGTVQWPDDNQLAVRPSKVVDLFGHPFAN